MADPVVTSADRKRARALMWLALAAALSAGAASLAAMTSQSARAVSALNEKMFPDLAARSGEAASISIASPDLNVTFRKNAGGAWTIAERDGYPANANGVRALVVSLAEMTLIERRTSDPARFSALELSTGPGGSGHVVTIRGANDEAIAALVAGKVQSQAQGATPGTLFVRRDGEDQTWLARGAMAIPASIGAALDKRLFTLDRGRIKSVHVEPNGLRAYTLARATPDTPDFTLENPPEGKRPVNPAALAAPATALSGLSFEDVHKANATLAGAPSLATFTTFDGLRIKASMWGGGADTVLVTFQASADEAGAVAAPPAADGATPPDPKAEAAAINARVEGWVYTLPFAVVQNLAPVLETLVEDAAPAPESGPDEGEPDEGDGAGEAPQP